MRVFRRSLVVILVLAGLGCVFLVVVFSSTFQTWAARRVLASQAGVIGSVGRVNAGTSHVRVEQLQLQQDGMSLAFPVIDVDLPVISAVRSVVAVRKVVAKGWTIDLTKAAPVSASPVTPVTPVTSAARPPAPNTPLASPVIAGPMLVSRAAFAGIMGQLRLPVDLSVEVVELEGEIIFPTSPGQPPARAKVVINGGQLGAGREGKFTIAATTTLAPAMPVNALAATGLVTVAMDTPRTFSRLGSQLDIDARGPQFPAGAKLSLAGTATRANAGESYTLEAETAGRKIATVQATYPAMGTGSTASTSVAGSWTVDARAEDFSPFTLGRPLPAFVTSGTGKFTVDPGLETYAASGRLDVSVDKLETIRAELGPVGAIKLAASFDVAQSGSRLLVKDVSGQVSAGRPVLAWRSIQAFEFDPATGELKVADPASDLLNIEFQGVPLAWTRALAKDVEIMGGDLRGSLVVGARNGGFALRTVEPLRATDLAVSQGGRPQLRAINFSTKVAADYAPPGWQAEFAGLTVTSGDATLLALDAKAGQLSGQDQPVKLTGQWRVDLPAVLTQPAANGYAVLTRGKASGDFAASLGREQELQAKLSLGELAMDPRMGVMALPAVQAEFRAKIDLGGTATINLPVNVEREGRSSDFTIAGTLARRANGQEIDASLTSAYLVTDDVQLLLAPLASAGAPVGAVPGKTGTTPSRDPAPPWRGLSGKVALALAKVVYQQKFEIANVVGTLRLDAGKVALEGLQAGLGPESDVALGGAVTFDEKLAEPYALKADLVINNFDPAPLFRALDAGKPASVEGKFHAASQLTGTGLNLGDLLGRTRGEIQLTSKGGVFRLLQAEVDKAQKTQAAVAMLGGLLGAVTGSEKISDYANRTQIVTDVAKAVSDIPFDQLNVAVTRDEDLTIKLRDFALISPEVRLSGAGEIRHVANLPLLAQPLALQLQLGARGRVGDLMNRVSMLDGKPDSLGYIGLVTPLRVNGSLDKPDTSEIKVAFGQAVLGTLLKGK